MKLQWSRMLAALLLICLLPVSALAAINTTWDLGVALDTFTFSDYPLTTEAVAAIKDLANAFRVRVNFCVAEQAGGLLDIELMYKEEPLSWVKVAYTKEALAFASDFLPEGWYIVPATGEYQALIESMWRAMCALEPALLDMEAYQQKAPALAEALSADLGKALEAFLVANPTVRQEVPALADTVYGAAKAYSISLDYTQVEPLLTTLIDTYAASDLYAEAQTANGKLTALMQDMLSALQEMMEPPKAEQAAVATSGQDVQQMKEMAAQFAEGMRNAGPYWLTATALVDEEGTLMSAQSVNLLGKAQDNVAMSTYNRATRADATVHNMYFAANSSYYYNTFHGYAAITDHVAEMGRVRTDLNGAGGWRAEKEGGTWQLTGHSDKNEGEIGPEDVPISYLQWAMDVTDDDDTKVGVTFDWMNRANIPGRQTQANTDTSSVLTLGMTLDQAEPAMQMALAVRFMLDTKSGLSQQPPDMPLLTGAVNLMEMDEAAAKKLTDFATVRLLTVAGKAIGDMPPEQFQALMYSGE